MLFGVAGVPHSSKGRSTLDGVKAIKELGLDAMEVQFVRGVKMKENKAKEVGISRNSESSGDVRERRRKSQTQA